ncbi:MAG TPA: hypothetical protein VJ044_14310 [Candidatus Hodarchaeales archaeon]|nr:hypothetical protein [Candidatus Hodarchaeales archaeon]
MIGRAKISTSKPREVVGKEVLVLGVEDVGPDEAEEGTVEVAGPEEVVEVEDVDPASYTAILNALFSPIVEK